MKTFIRSLTLGALTLGLALIAPNLATAQIVESGPYWTAAASTCTPDKYNNNKHGFLRSDFFFDGSAVGVILARCNVTNPLDGIGATPNWNALIVGFQDPDGTTPHVSVLTRLIRVSRPTGDTSVVATLNSNTDALTTRHERFAQFNASAINFRNYEYYVEIYLIRPSTAVVSPRAYSLRLANVTVVQ